jgi:hypothetical protein
MTNKYTKNEHMRHLNDGATPIDPEAKKLIGDRMLKASINGQTKNAAPKHIGQWLQVTHRAAFNKDFEQHVKLHWYDKHCMS